MPEVYCGQGSAARLLPKEDGDKEVETSEPVTYCVRAGGEAGPGGGPLPDPGRQHSTSPSFSVDAACCDDSADDCSLPIAGLYALLGISRCWWKYTVTLPPTPDDASDAMEEGVATESRGGTSPEVTGIGWSLPCSLSSLLAMNCRARAEGLARRLQAKVRLGNGGTSAFEQTSLVNPGPEDHYASMECRHSSLDNPHLDLLEGSNLRPIHVVTSEPTLHMCHAPQPALTNLQEQDSDVYYDFDLASPDEAAEADEEGDKATEEQEDDTQERRQSEGGERPESGCVTSVTSPVMFDDERDDNDEEAEDASGPAGDPFSLEESIACTPDADLRAVRQILSYTSLNDAQSLAIVSADKGSCVQNGECAVCDELRGSDCGHGYYGGGGGSGGGAWCSHRSHAAAGRSPGTAATGTEGAAVGTGTDTCARHPMWVTAPVAKSGSCWCHHSPGTPPAVPRTSAGRLACYVSPTLFDTSSNRSNGETDWGEVSETCRVENCVMINNEGHNKDEQGHENTQALPEEDGHATRTVAKETLQDSSLEGDPVLTKHQETAEAFPSTEEEHILKSSPESATVPQAISGSTPPPADPHLYPTSEARPATMEAREEDEGDLQGKGEAHCPEEDTEVIETLDENEEASDDDANEEDIEEESILTGKFRNFRCYKERVRRLSDEAEDRSPPLSILLYDDANLPEQQEDEKKDVEEEGTEGSVSGSELATQLSELQVEDVGIQVDSGDTESSSDDVGTRSSSEETDPERVEDFKMRIKRSSSLKCGKTPPGTPGRKKIVRFADVLGLDLAAVRTFLGGGVPHVPRSAFWDLQVERRSSKSEGAKATEKLPSMPRRVLTPLFQQPGLQHNFLERVRNQRVVVETVDVGEDMSVRGLVRVFNLDFHKSVMVRYTFDNWRNFHEANATYVPGSYDGLTDQFSFLLWGSFLQDNAALMFCVRYSTLGQEFWDNNFGRNYGLQCYTTTEQQVEGVSNGVPRPQNSSMVHEHFNNEASASSRHPPFSTFSGSPTTPGDPWATRFF